MSQQHRHALHHSHKESPVRQPFTMSQHPQHSPQHSHKESPRQGGGPRRRLRAKTRLHGFQCCNSHQVNFWSLGGEVLSRLQLQFHLAQFGTIARLFLRHGGLEGYVVYERGANLRAAAGRSVAVAGGSCVAFVWASLPRVFLGGLGICATEEAVRAAVAPYGRVAIYERPRRNGRDAGYCLLTFFKEEEVEQILQQQRVEVLGRKVSVRMEGERKEKDRIYDAYGPEWREGRTLLLYGIAEPYELTEQDVREAMSKYGSVRAVNFVFQSGRRQPRCFVDFAHETSVKAALRLGAGCVQGQLVGFMEVTSSFLAAVTHRPKVRVTEDPLDDDLEVPPVREFDITKKEKEEALQRALWLLDAVNAAFLTLNEKTLVEDIKMLASTCLEDETDDEEEGKSSHRKMTEEEELESCALEESYLWQDDAEEDYEDKEDGNDHGSNKKPRKDVYPSERICKKLHVEDFAEDRTTELAEKGMENEEEARSSRGESEGKPPESLCTKTCATNYGLVRKKVLELTRQCSARDQVRKNMDNNWSRLLRATLQEQQSAVLQPAPAQDTLEAKEGWKDEYVSDEACRVYIQNLPEDIERQALMRHFVKFGDVLRLYLTRGNKGFVEYEFPAPVAAVLSKTRHVVDGREIRVLKSLSDQQRVWVGRLPWGAKSEDVAQALAVFGVVQDVIIAMGCNYGFVILSDEEAVRRAVACGEAFLGGHRLVIKGDTSSLRRSAARTSV